jgi:hypothetical protein
MTNTYKVEFEIILTDEQQQRVIEAARHACSNSQVSTQEDDGSMREIPVEFVNGPVAALMEIVRQNQILDDIGIDVDKVSCTDPEYEAASEDLEAEQLQRESPEVDDDDLADDDENDLDDWDGGLYLCRWPNGEFSVVKAESKRDAIIQLDEWAGAHVSWLAPLDTFMADFTLNDLGQIELGEFGEETEEFIRDHCYPELEAVLSRDDVMPTDGGDYSTEGKEKIRQAVEFEKVRLWRDQPQGPAAKTELGKELQARMGTTGIVADHYVKMRAKRLLKSKLGEDGKPN